MVNVKMTPVVGSSNIKAIGRDGDKLCVQFQNGGTYEYDGAAHHYDRMLNSDSAGSYFHVNVKSKHQWRKVS